MSDTNYLFVDGGYLRRRYADAMQRVFCDDGELEVRNFLSWFQGKFDRPRRVFYYDCLHDVRLDGEAEEQFKLRVEKQTTDFQKIQSLPGFHVRRGRLTGRAGNLRQKGVDVLLAVEMLDHSFRKNMDGAWLLAGDADFVPLVEAVIRLGTWVEVFYDPRAGSRELFSAADQGVPFSFDDVFTWSSVTTQNRCRVPQRLDFRASHLAGLVKSATTVFGKDQAGRDYAFGQNPGGSYILSQNLPDSSTAFTHERVDVLKRYAK